MRSHFYIILLLCCLGVSTARGQYTYHFNTTAASIYEQVLRLELDSAATSLATLQSQQPHNLVYEHLASYVDFFQLYLTEDKALLEKRLPEKDRRIRSLERLPKESPWRNYAIAEVRLHWALIRLRFESYYPAFRDVNKAHKLLRDNAKRFPDFLPTYKDLGLLHAAVGSIPPQFKWGVELLSSLKGSIAEGSEEMQLALVDEDHPFHRETAVLYALLRLHLANEPDAAWQIVNELGLRPNDNKLHCFVLSNIAMRSGRNNRAIALLEKQPRGGTAQDFPYLDFMLGLAKLRNLDPSARIHFQSFLLRFAGQHFIKEAHQKIAWSELLRNRVDLYRKRMAEVGQKGGATAGGDRNARNEAQREQPPHLGLLKARLLFDGAYFQRARTVMDTIQDSSLQTPELELEYFYRTGRILHGLKDYPGALSFYERTISLGQQSDAFFACNAALQAGLIEELRGNNNKARTYFELCLSMSPDEYRTGLHIQAKAGLNRI
ncbi:MAG: hypothetical protein AAFQ37_09800 [Bacteroidota bacterium]